ncbi:MAG: extracellular solute-binding protein [Lachnospiraceae bacterium]|nr:extracellular solute-binding protein [Lachnospiraceae bacterium]
MKKRLFATLLSAACILSMTACGSEPASVSQSVKAETAASEKKEEKKEEAPVEVRDVKLTVWSPSEDQDPDNGQWIVTLCNKFNEEHPEWNITYEFGVHSESEVKKELPKDLEAGADVFIFGSSGLENLVNGAAIAEIGGSYAESIKNDYSSTLVQLCTYEDGGVYGFPMTTDSYFMYYDKSKFTEDDVKSLDQMLTKGNVAIALSNGFYLGAFFTGAGGKFFGEDDEFVREKGIVINNDENLEMVKYLVDLAKNPNFTNAEPADAISMMQEGTVNALWSGTWSSADVKAVLGDNFGVAPLPKAKVNGKDVQLRPFASAKAIGVKSTCKDPDVAMALASYLSSEDSQRLHFELRGYVPAIKSLMNDPAVQADTIVSVDSWSSDNIGYPRPCFAEFGYFWTPAQTFGEEIRDGVINYDNAKEKLDALNTAVNTSGAE